MRVAGANDRINIGHIGIGVNGIWHLRLFVRQSDEEKDVQVVAVSEVYSARKERARHEARLEPKDVHHDYRELLARQDVDAVFIATPDHWHAQMAIDAMAAGKDVYLQKPMTLTIDESAQVAAAAARYGRVLQIGSQHVSDPRYGKARELIASGAIGEVVWAESRDCGSDPSGIWNWDIEKEGTPENIDWARWLGSAPKRPFSPERYFRWRKYWDYSGGFATDKLYHNLAPLLYAIGPQFPTRVTGAGGIYYQKDREVPDQYTTTIEYPDFYICLHAGGNTSGPNRLSPIAVYGRKGSIVFEKDRILLAPEAGAAQRRPEDAPKLTSIEVPQGDFGRKHVDNFLACVRSRQKPVLHAEFGYQAMVALRLGNDSYREGKVKLFDPASMQVRESAPARPSYEGQP
jgi:predicted dehydrogenase